MGGEGGIFSNGAVFSFFLKIYCEWICYSGWRKKKMIKLRNYYSLLQERAFLYRSIIVESLTIEFLINTLNSDAIS